MRITEVTPILLRGDERYGARDDREEATDQGDWLLLVRVATDEGIEGWADIETLGPVAARVLSGHGMGALGFRTIGEQLVGRDPLDIRGIWDELYIATAYYGRRGVTMHCVSAVDNCLWSIRAQAEGVPLSGLLGVRRRDRLPAYASTLFRATPDANASAAARYAGLGFRGVKFGWGGFGVDHGRDRENLAAIRAALGPGRTLMVDPGWYVEDAGRPRTRTAAQTRAMLATLREADPYWVEDFAHPECPEAYAEAKREFPWLRAAAGEQQATLWDFRRLVQEGRVDVLQPDLSRCGGLTVATALAPEAAAAGREIVTHSWLTDLLHAYSLHYLSTLPEAHWVEFNVAQSTLSRGVAAAPLRLCADGTIPVPDTPGLGVTLDMDFITAHRSPVP
ncbi:enolase [Sphaerisporangium siamense]|uniref:L-alanine-DL-glutamate epimerase-like enolase superfamily enzyme n=1 Tax=Sphaerisporangium siamense TaxID=795645 RepID=A0A7W7D5A8_9ACTN|nr:mandelate racemase/muconate lactonizing enzyme family protein [Sphaerisporangium siamense]MBB4700574.1 L-alanine-DL-glutamate epimerase-like enolase superfamily enzyme [Sphaerisporangium siamense]GII88896.1 enolase [Sphaerisporangium siamense]